MTYSKSVLYPQHPTQSLAHNRTLKYFLNEHDVGPQFPPPHNRVGRMRMDSPGGQYWCQMHLLCARLGWGERLMEVSTWPK